jgi:hypothetical protein
MLTNHRLGAAHSMQGHSAVERFPRVLDQASHNGSIDSETVDAIRPLASASAGPIPDRANSTPLLDFYWSGKDFSCSCERTIAALCPIFAPFSPRFTPG